MRSPAGAPGAPDAAIAAFAADVRASLTRHPRQVPPRYFYDALGSALFEAICRLPWYTITRVEERLIAAHGAEILARTEAATLVELGAGSGDKLHALLAAGAADRDLTVHLIDGSTSALAAATTRLAARAHTRVVAHASAYEAGLDDAARAFSGGNRVLALFLGSNLGNFDPAAGDAFLRHLRTRLREGDGLLLGLDLVKPERALLAAYDDPLGVTAAFNRNLLVRMNRELDADFPVDAFAHRVVWRPDASRIEMHLEAQSALDVHVRAAGLRFSMPPGERLWTESSYKYRPEAIGPVLARAGFALEADWTDARDAFALVLAAAA
jgi:L-histidine N-alpha-methyltransferase